MKNFIWIIPYIFVIFLIENIKTQDNNPNQCLQKIVISNTEEELFNYFKEENFIRNLSLQQINQCIFILLKSGKLNTLENLLRELEENKISLHESIKFKEIRKSLNENIEKLSNILDNLKNVVRNYEKNIQIVQPAFKWAQNKDFIIIEIKYSHRLDSPGCLELEDLKVDISYDKIFDFSGFCTLGDVPIKFELNLKLFGEINRLQSSWQSNSVGKFMLNLRKKAITKWPSLLRDGENQPQNMQIWLEMQDQFDMKEKNNEEEEDDDEELDYDELMNEKNKNKKKNRRPKYNFGILNTNKYLHTN